MSEDAWALVLAFVIGMVIGTEVLLLAEFVRHVTH